MVNFCAYGNGYRDFRTAAGRMCENGRYGKSVHFPPGTPGTGGKNGWRQKARKGARMKNGGRLAAVSRKRPSENRKIWRKSPLSFFRTVTDNRKQPQKSPCRLRGQTAGADGCFGDLLFFGGGRLRGFAWEFCLKGFAERGLCLGAFPQGLYPRLRPSQFCSAR